MERLSLAARLARIEKLEEELTRQGAALIGVGASLSYADFFIMGAVRRTLAQARGFRDLIGARNFPCAAAILRLQLDTAMRVNALSLVEDADVACEVVLGGGKFNRLKDRQGNKLTDHYLRNVLSEEHPWVSSVYERASNFVHLSGSHFEVAIACTDENTRLAHFQLSGQDPQRADEAYFEAVDAFFQATRLAAMTLLAFWMSRHQGDAALASSTSGSVVRSPGR
jgi:hypothetical protein